MDYYRRFPGDYRRDTSHLTLQEHGAYALLLDHCYSTELPIKSLDAAYRICSAATKHEKNSVKSVLGQFFSFNVDGYSQNRVQKEIKYAESISKVRRRAAEIRHGKDANAEQMQSIRNAISDNQTTRQPDKENFLTPLSEPAVPKREKKTKVLVSWPSIELTQEMRLYAQQHGVPNADTEFDAWRDYCYAHNSKYADWQAAWRTRCRRYKDFHPNGGGNGERKTFDTMRRETSGEAIRRTVAAYRQVGGNLLRAPSQGDKPDSDGGVH